ncbi:MAG: hypothetical protein GDA43_03365 [Hormoscilla sp. SP5CHS1]|nr:hypothetical protein [Hormoscilla sp. SP5CHS1]
MVLDAANVAKPRQARQEPYAKPPDPRQVPIARQCYRKLRHTEMAI